MRHVYIKMGTNFCNWLVKCDEMLKTLSSAPGKHCLCTNTHTHTDHEFPCNSVCVGKGSLVIL